MHGPYAACSQVAGDRLLCTALRQLLVLQHDARCALGANVSRLCIDWLPVLLTSSLASHDAACSTPAAAAGWSGSAAGPRWQPPAAPAGWLCAGCHLLLTCLPAADSMSCSLAHALISTWMQRWQMLVRAGSQAGLASIACGILHQRCSCMDCSGLLLHFCALAGVAGACGIPRACMRAVCARRAAAWRAAARWACCCRVTCLALAASRAASSSCWRTCACDACLRESDAQTRAGQCICLMSLPCIMPGTCCGLSSLGMQAQETGSGWHDRQLTWMSARISAAVTSCAAAACLAACSCASAAHPGLLQCCTEPVAIISTPAKVPRLSMH